MPTGLRRFHKTGDFHFICINCFRKRPIFDSPEARDTFLAILEETRRKYSFRVVAYVVMPTHVHLLISEPEHGGLATAMQVLKQRFSRTRVLEEEVWERRYYDLNVFSAGKLYEKIEYIHMNPVVAGLVETPAEWHWSSYDEDAGPVVVTR